MHQFFTITEVAHAVKVCDVTVRNWIASGKLRAVKIGGAVRITQAEFERATSNVIKPPVESTPTQ
jgi:excisionase family DNA binding protein